MKVLADMNFGHIANSCASLDTSQHKPPVLPCSHLSKTLSLLKQRTFQHINRGGRNGCKQMSTKKSFTAEIFTMIEPSMFNEFAVLAIPAHILPTHIQPIHLHKSELG